MPPGPRLVFRISINSSLPLGGTLSVTTCGFTTSNTVIHLGTGCPLGGYTFNCLVFNDDAALCPSNPLASTVSRIATVNTYFVQVGSPVGGSWSSGLQWTYTPPGVSSSVTPTTSRTASRTQTRTKTSSCTRTRSRSKKRKVVM